MKNEYCALKFQVKDGNTSIYTLEARNERNPYVYDASHFYHNAICEVGNVKGITVHIDHWLNPATGGLSRAVFVTKPA